MKKKTVLILGALLLQLLTLSVLAGKREWIAHTGKTLWLRTVPIDPRNLFRGDYLRLRYEISNVPTALISPDLRQELLHRKKLPRAKKTAVFVRLGLDASGLAHIVQAEKTPPSEGLFLRGHVRARNLQEDGSLSSLEYGLDTFFVEQGAGKTLEDGLVPGAPKGIRTPLEMQIALAQDGTALLTGYRWAALGMDVQLEGQADNATNPLQLRIIFANTSKKGIALLLPEDLSTLALVGAWEPPPAQSFKFPEQIQPEAVRLLSPGASTEVVLHLEDPRWFVQAQDDAPASCIPSWHRDAQYNTYKIIYKTPPPAAYANIPLSDEVWTGSLESPHFYPKFF